MTLSFHLIFGIIPVPVIWTDRFLASWSGGTSRGFFCIIRPKYKEDRGILEHELTHCKQFYRTLSIHVWLYKFSEKYRLNAEVEAYKKQLEFYADKEFYIGWMAIAIATKYKLNVSIETVKNLLRG